LRDSSDQPACAPQRTRPPICVAGNFADAMNALAAGAATDTGMLIELHGTQRGEFTCDCGRHHIIEIAEGEMRVYHTEE
jgi:hypothetical protein